MGLLGRLAAAWRPDGQKRKPKKPVEGLFGNIGIWPNNNSLGGTYAATTTFEGWVFAAIDRVASLAAANEPIIGRKNPSPSPFQSQRPESRVIPFAANHPLCELLDEPNPVDTPFEFWYSIYTDKRLTGTAYIWIVRDENDIPVELWQVPSFWVYPVADKSGSHLVDHYNINFNATNAAGGWRVNPTDMIVFRSPSPFTKIGGISTVLAASKQIDLDLMIRSARWYAMVNGANIGGWLETDAAFAGGYDDGELQNLLAQFRAQYSGYDKFSAPGVLPPGVIFKKDLADREIAFNESAKQTRQEVFAFFGVSDEILGFHESSNRATANAAIYQLYLLRLAPEWYQMGKNLRRLAREFDPEAIIVWPNCTPEDRDQIRQDLEAVKDALSINEKRAYVGLPAYPEEIYDRPQMPMEQSPMLPDFGDLNDPQGDEQESELDRAVHPPRSAAKEDMAEDGQERSAANNAPRFSANGKH